MNSNTILIVGSIGIDTIETPKEKREDILGGSVSYALVSAGHASRVSVVGVVGEDFPPSATRHYETYASDLTDMIKMNGRTFRWGGRYFENGDDRETLFTELGVFESFNPVLSEVNKHHPWVFLANIHPTLQLSVMEQCDPQSRFVVDTMNLWIETTPQELRYVLDRTNILLINESESQLLTGRESLDDSAQELMDLGIDTVVIKCGSRGAKTYSSTKQFSVGVFPVKNIADPTGAGDTFGGGFVSTLAQGQSLENAVINGSAWASFCVEGFGVESLVDVSEDALNYRRDAISLTLTP